MSTALNLKGEAQPLPQIENPKKFKAAVITADWNPTVTGALRKGAVETLHAAGVPDENIALYAVPGTVELVNAAAAVINKDPKLSAVIVLGCVIRGGTPHFEYVCQIVSQGTAMLNARGTIPVIFGVLTVENMKQALDRAGGQLGNKGSEAAATAIAMYNLHNALR